MASKKHADVIRAWLDGKAIQVYNSYGDEWVDCDEPSFICGSKYRVKPTEIRIEGFTLSLAQATVLFGLLNSFAAARELEKVKEDMHMEGCFPEAMFDTFRKVDAVRVQGEMYRTLGKDIEQKVKAALA